MNSSTSGGAGTMAENVVAGSVPMATATSNRDPFSLPSATCGRPPIGPSGMRDRAARRLRHRGHARRLLAELPAARVRNRRIAQGFAVVLRGHLLPLPVHAGGLAVVHLHPIHADIAFAGARIARVHARQRDEPPAIVRPALQNRKRVQVEACSRRITSLHRASLALTVFGNALVSAPSCGSILSLSNRPSGAFTFISPEMRVRNFLDPLHAQRQRHAPLAAELVDQHLVPRMPFHVLEQQRRTAGRILGSLPRFPPRPAPRSSTPGR